MLVSLGVGLFANEILIILTRPAYLPAAPYVGFLTLMYVFTVFGFILAAMIDREKRGEGFFPLLLNVISLGASLGILVWVFQDGNLEWLFRFESLGGIESVIPLLVLAFGFGLSMDYEVFLLARIIELHEQGYDDDTAVRLGLQRSGRIITSAAVIMVIVFSGFAVDLHILVRVPAFQDIGRDA